MLPAYAPQCPAGATPVIDSAIVTVQIGAAQSWRKHKYSAAQRTRILYYADAIRQHFVPPTSLGEIPMLGVTRTDSGERSSGKRPEAGNRVAVSGRLVIVVKADGRLKAQAWENTPVSVSFANAVTRATVVADSMGAFADMPPVGSNDGDTLALTIISRAQALEGEPTLLRARIPAYVAAMGARVERQQLAEYPEAARASAAENDGEVHFVVGSDGRAVPSSVTVTSTEFSDFIEPMRTAVVNGSYHAGISGGCSVPMAVSQEFAFRIRPRP
ncbi:MAG TPA: hypothetical protein VE861_09660 [Gemmatimonadaceae bacterium]|nr:hypothetical protein [Gemmatimonadaceae bacterium]